MGFLYPIALLSSALIGVLVLLYLWERLRRRVEVPSLLLWQSVPEDPVQLRRFRPDWLFLLQLLLLSALVAGLARPYLEGALLEDPALRHVLIIDSSASMQAREGKRTRFEEAKERAVELLRKLDDADEVMLITVAQRPEVVANFTRDRDSLIESVRSLEALDTGTNLAPAIALAQRARARDPDRTEIVLFSDLPPTALDPQDRPFVRCWSIGTASDNVAISSLHVFQGPFEDAVRARAYVLVRNFGYGEQHGVLTVSLGEKVITRKGFTIQGRGTRTFLAKGFPGPGLVTASLEVEDALAADNRAYGWVRGTRGLKLLLVSPPSPLVEDLRQIARAVPGLQLERVAPEEYVAADATRFDTVIFHRFAPAPPPVSTLYVYPPADGSLFRIVGHTTGAEIVDWNDRHGGLAGMRPLPPWPMKAARIIQPPPGSETLLWSRTGDHEFPLIFTNNAGGNPMACIAFDLEAEHLLSNENLSLVVMLLNLLDWLSPKDSISPPVVSTGEVVIVDGLRRDLPVRVVDPRGRTTTGAPGEPEVEATHTGLYTISTDGSSRNVVANLFDPNESDIGRGGNTLTAPSSFSPQKDRAPAKHEFGWWLYAVAASLLLLEWIAWRRRE